MDFPNTEEKPQHPTLLCEIDDHSGDRDFYSSNGYAIFEPFWAPWPSYIAPLRVLEGAVIEPHVIIKQVPEHTNIVSKTEWILPGTLDGAAVDAYPDTGSCVNAIPLEFARKQGWLIRSRPNLSKVKLPANRSVRPLGVVTLPWRFSGETTVYNVEFLVLRKCIYRVILGQEFLISSKSLDILHYRRRFKKKRVYSERRKRLCFLGSSFDKARGAFNGHTAWVLADTGSDVMVVSRQYAVSHNFDIEAGDDFREELEFADGYVRRADGMVLNAEWSFGKGSRKYRDNFFVLDGIDADIILSNSFLFRNRILSTPGLFGSSVHGGQTAPFDSPRLNLIKYLNNRLPQSSDSSHSDDDDDALAWADDDELEHVRRANAEDIIHKLAEDARNAAWAEEYRKRAEWEQRKASLVASVQTSIPQNPTQNPQPSTKARRRFRLIFWGKGRQKP